VESAGEKHLEQASQAIELEPRWPESNSFDEIKVQIRKALYRIIRSDQMARAAQ